MVFTTHRRRLCRIGCLAFIHLAMCGVYPGVVAAVDPSDCRCSADKSHANSTRPSQEIAHVRLDSDSPRYGPANAPVTIVEYGDFQCPFTDRARSVVMRVLRENKSAARFYFKAIPIDSHGAIAATEAEYFEAVSALYPERRWEYFNALFDARAQIKVGGVGALRAVTKRLKIDLTRIDAELDQSTVHYRVRSNLIEAARLHIGETPTFLVNGRLLSSEAGAGGLASLVADESTARNGK